MISQKDLSFQIISQMRDQGRSDSEILLQGPGILLEMFRKGEWIKSKGSDSDQDILKYSKDLLKNWMKKDVRLNGGDKYVPKNPRGPRESTSSTPDYRMILDHLRKSDPNSPLIVEIEEKIMWEEIQKVG